MAIVSPAQGQSTVFGPAAPDPGSAAGPGRLDGNFPATHGWPGREKGKIYPRMGDWAFFFESTFFSCQVIHVTLESIIRGAPSLRIKSPNLPPVMLVGRAGVARQGCSCGLP